MHEIILLKKYSYESIGRYDCNQLSNALFQDDTFVLQNRLASTRTDLGGKACSGTRPALKPRAALGEIGNIALNKEPLKKVSGKYIDSKFHFAIIRSDEVQWYLGGLF